jgi:signal transduction histidine kinase
MRAMAERLSKELRIFHELARVVASGPYDVGELLERICTEIRAAFGFQRALVARYDAEERTVHAVVQQGIDWPGDQWLLVEKFPFLEHALAAGEAVFVQDARTEAAMPSKIIDRFGVRSLVAIPLLMEGECLGFIVGDRKGGEFKLTAEELDLLSALGTVAAVFIGKAQQYAELQRALEELRTLDQAKDDFISIASHELRTPIAVVHGIASTLHLRGNQLRREQVTELRAALYEQTSRLRMLAEQLLDLSRIDAGVVTVRHQRFRPRERFDSLLPRIAPDRLDDVQVDIDPRLEVETDPEAVERVLSNLVLNALSYGRPPVEVRSEPNGEELRLVVEDRGDGVDPDFVPQLFERFTRSDDSRAHRQEGAGLGLAIASSFAEAIGGELVYERAEPFGARFALVLPERGDRDDVHAHAAAHRLW